MIDMTKAAMEMVENAKAYDQAIAPAYLSQDHYRLIAAAELGKALDILGADFFEAVTDGFTPETVALVVR